MIRRPPRSTLSSSSAASDVYKRQPYSGVRIHAPTRRKGGVIILSAVRRQWGKHNDDSSKVISAFVSAALYLTSLVLAIDLRLQKKASQLLRDAFRLATIECRSVAKAL